MKNQPSQTNIDLSIQSQEEAVKLILDNIDHTFLILDTNFRIVLTNTATRQQAKQLFGVDITSNTSALELVEPERLPFIKNIYNKVLNGSVETTEAKIAGQTGVTYIKTYFRPLRDACNTIVGIVVNARNITEKKRAEAEQLKVEEELKLSEQHYKNLFHNNPLPCWIYDFQTLQFLEVNEATVRHYGYSREEFLKMTLRDLQVEENLDHFEDLFSHQKVTRFHFLNNWQHRLKDGRRIFIDLKSNAINYQGKEARLAVVQDVTPRVVIENELRKSNERFRLAAIASSEALWEWDVVTEEAYISPTYTDILGWRADEFRKFDEWEDYIHPDDKQATYKSYHDAVADSHTERWEREYRYLKSDGNYAWVHDKAVILRDAEGKAIKVIGALQNITGQKQNEEEIRQSNERYKHVILATHDMIWDWDLATGLILWSESFFKNFGWPMPKNSLMGFDFCLNNFHPDDRDRVAQSIYDVINDANVTNWQQEFRYRKANGTYAYISDRGYVIRDGEGKAIRMIGAMKDITERKFNEKILSLERTIFELSANPAQEIKTVVKAFLKGIEEIFPDAITSVFLLREDDRIDSLVSPRLPVGLTSEIEGSRIGPEEGSNGAAMYFKKTIIAADVENDPLYKKYKDLASRFNLKACWSFPIIHTNGKVMGSFSVYYETPQDPTPIQLATFDRFKNILRVIMENRWSLQEIKTANERFDIMMNATHDLVWDWDLRANTIYRDPVGLENVYGLDKREGGLSVHQWLTHIHPEDLDRINKIIEEVLQCTAENNFEVEYRFRKGNGQYVHIYDRGIIIRDENNKPIRMIGAAQDISERKRLERELLNNELEHQKAINQATIETQEQERTEIGKELHDNVNQVLTTTKLYLDLAQSNPELKDDLIQKSTKNILDVINEIRQLSRSLMDPSIGDLGLIDSIHDLIENINLTRKLHVSLSAVEDIEDLLDKNQKLTIFRIIQEALNNAIRHAKATSVAITIAEKAGSGEVIIEDNGIGFNVKTVKRGAGLKNIQNRIYLINGSHTIESSLNKGSRIIINFPIIQTNTLHPQ